MNVIINKIINFPFPMLLPENRDQGKERNFCDSLRGKPVRSVNAVKTTVTYAWP